MFGHSRSDGVSVSAPFDGDVGDCSLVGGLCGIGDFVDRLWLDLRAVVRWS